MLLHFLFLEALSCLCTLPGIGDLLLRAGLLQPGSLHSLPSCSPVLWQLGWAEQCPSACRDTALPVGKEISTGTGLRAFHWQSPSPFLSFARGWYKQPGPDSSGRDWDQCELGGANYPVLTRERLWLCTLMRSRLPRWVISLETRWVLTQGNEPVPGGSGHALAQLCLQQQSS